MIRKKFVIHEHHARNLHFDLRLEIDGVLKSWAVPKGPSLDPSKKRLAVLVPDHSLKYGDFEGEISEGSYGAGEVRIWDDGTYETELDPAKQFENGKINVTFFGLKIRGEFVLTRLSNNPKNWLLIKSKDHFVDRDWKIETVLPYTSKKYALSRK